MPLPEEPLYLCDRVGSVVRLQRRALGQSRRGLKAGTQISPFPQARKFLATLQL